MHRSTDGGKVFRIKSESTEIGPILNNKHMKQTAAT